MSFETIVTRVFGMSTPAIWAFLVLLTVTFCAGGLIYRHHLKNRKDREPFDLRMPFFRLKTGHAEDLPPKSGERGPALPAADSDDAEGKIPDQRPSNAPARTTPHQA